MSIEPLSVDAAIGLLDAGAPQDEQEQAPAEAQAQDTPETSGDPTAEEADAPLEEASEGEGEEQEGDPAEPVIAAPKSWDAEARAAFAQLPRGAQEKIAAREDERDRAVSKAQQESADARKTAEAEASSIGQFKAQLETLVPQAQRVFGDRWQNVDWVAWAQQDPAAAQIGRMQFDAEKAQLAQLEAAHQQTRNQAFQRFVAEEGQKLTELAPDLVDPKQGPARKQALAKFLIDNGADPKVLPTLNAASLAMAYDAMRYRAAQKSLTTPKTPPAKVPVKPGSSQPTSFKSRTVDTAKNRFAQTGSVDDAVAFLNARSG